MPVCVVSPVPLRDWEAAPAEDPDVSDFLAFLDFLAFFLVVGLVSPVASVDPLVASVAEGEVPLAPVALGLVPEVEVPVESLVPLLRVVPAALEPVAPGAPDEASPAPDAPDGDVPLVPEEASAGWPGWPVCGGMELEVPLPPAMPASLPVPAPVAPVALCERTVDDGEVVLSLAAPLCANAMEDTDATMTNDSD